VTVAFHQKKAAPSNDEFEVESTVAQWDESTEEECLSPCEGEEDSVLSDMGTNGSVGCCPLLYLTEESSHEASEEIHVFT